MKFIYSLLAVSLLASGCAKAHAKTYRKARRGERRTRTLGAPRSKPKGSKR